jgi:hypothetical protein
VLSSTRRVLLQPHTHARRGFTIGTVYWKKESKQQSVHGKLSDVGRCARMLSTDHIVMARARQRGQVQTPVGCAGTAFRRARPDLARAFGFLAAN